MLFLFVVSLCLAESIKNGDFEGSLVYYGGDWSVRDGVVRQSSFNCRAIAAWNFSPPENYTLEMDARKVDGANGPLIIFRCDSLTNYYCVNLSVSPSQIAFQHISGESISNISKDSYVNFTNDKWYRLRVVCNSGQFRFFVNGSQRLSTKVSGKMIENTSIGIGSIDSVVEFRNIVLIGPGGRKIFNPSLKDETSNIANWNVSDGGEATVLREGKKGSKCLFINNKGSISLSQTGVELEKDSIYRLSMQFKSMDFDTIPDEVYLFVYYSWIGIKGPQYAYSLDGMVWIKMNDKLIFTPDVGDEERFRDPSIVKGPDGLFHMVWTIGWDQKSIGIAHSKDLCNWSLQKELPVMAHKRNAENCWNPYIFYDEASGKYYIFWASSLTGEFPATANTSPDGRNHRIFFTTTKDFVSYAPAKLLFDNDKNVISPAVVKIPHSGYAIFLKNESTWPEEKNISLMTSPDLEHWTSQLSEPIHGKFWAEGPMPLLIDDCWYVYYERYMDSKCGAVCSYDLKNWKDISDRVKLPQGLRQGSIIKISRDEFNVLADYLHQGMKMPEEVKISISDNGIDIWDGSLKTLSPDWTEFTADFSNILPTKAAIVKIEIAGESQVWIDDVSLKKIRGSF